MDWSQESQQPGPSKFTKMNFFHSSIKSTQCSQDNPKSEPAAFLDQHFLSMMQYHLTFSVRTSPARMRRMPSPRSLHQTGDPHISDHTVRKPNLTHSSADGMSKKNEYAHSFRCKNCLRWFFLFTHGRVARKLCLLKPFDVATCILYKSPQTFNYRRAE